MSYHDRTGRTESSPNGPSTQESMIEVERAIPTLFVADHDAACAWYERVLGFERRFVMPETRDRLAEVSSPTTVHDVQAMSQECSARAVVAK